MMCYQVSAVQSAFELCWQDASVEMIVDAFCLLHAEMALLGISLTLGFGFVRPFCCFALGILAVDFCFLDAPLN